MITVLHYGLSENLGGIETYALKILNNIDKNAFSFCYLDDKENGICIKNQVEKFGCKVFKITSRRTNAYQNIKDIEQIFDKNHIDIFHIHINTMSYVTPIRIALKKNIPVIVHSRNAGCAYELHTLVLHEVNKTIFRFNKDLTRIAVSKKAGEWLFGKKTVFSVFNNGIDIEKRKFDLNDRVKYRKKFLVNDSTRVIIHIGTFLPAKNHKYLIAVFKEYLSHNKNAVLWLIGDGPLKEEIENYVKVLNLTDKVIFFGKRIDIKELICAADLLLFPSKFEGFPNVVLEAQTSGLPCIISDNITNEIAIRKDCVKFSLNRSCSEWSDLISKTLNNSDIDRKNAWKEINDLGFNVKDEIIRLQNLYTFLANK